MKNRLWTIIGVACGLLLAISSPARADDLVDQAQLSASTWGWAIHSNATLEQTFTVGCTGTLTGVELILSGSAGADDLIVEIRDASSGLPSTLIGQVAITPADIGPYVTGLSASSVTATFIDLSALDIGVVAGEVLSVRLRSDSVLPKLYSLRTVYPPADPYAGGGLFNGQGDPLPADAAFKTFVEPAPATIEAAADTSLSSGTHQSQGEDTVLRVRASGNRLALVAFDQGEIDDAVGSKAVTRATLRLYIGNNEGNWSADGRLLGVHRMTMAWTEYGATWNCPDDLDTSNSQPDGDTWKVSGNDSTLWPCVAEPTDSLLHTNGLVGWVEFDVTNDVEGWLAGTSVNYGWMVRRDEDGGAGLVEYTSREGAANTPELVIEFD